MYILVRLYTLYELICKITKFLLFAVHMTTITTIYETLNYPFLLFSVASDVHIDVVRETYFVVFVFLVFCYLIL